MIKHPHTFAAAPPAGFDGEFLWDFLQSAWRNDDGSGRITPMDFDAVVERRGFFLQFETKAPGVPVPQGQMITLREVVKDPRWTVVFCAKRPSDVDGWDVLTRHGVTRFNGDAYALRAWCAMWFIHASGGDLRRCRAARDARREREPGEEG